MDDAPKFDTEKIIRNHNALVKAVEDRFGKLETPKDLNNAFKSLGIDSPIFSKSMLRNFPLSDEQKALGYGYLYHFMNMKDLDKFKVQFFDTDDQNAAGVSAPTLQQLEAGDVRPTIKIITNPTTGALSPGKLMDNVGVQSALAVGRDYRDRMTKRELKKLGDIVMNADIAHHEFGHVLHLIAGYTDAFGPPESWDSQKILKYVDDVVADQGNKLMEPIWQGTLGDEINKIDALLASENRFRDLILSRKTRHIDGRELTDTEVKLNVAAVDRRIKQLQTEKLAYAKNFRDIGFDDLAEVIEAGGTVNDLLRNHRKRFTMAADKMFPHDDKYVAQLPEEQKTRLVLQMVHARRLRDDLTDDELEHVRKMSAKISDYAHNPVWHLYTNLYLNQPMEFYAELNAMFNSGLQIENLTTQDKQVLKKVLDWMVGPEAFDRFIAGKGLGD
jgi:hypothetical protein